MGQEGSSFSKEREGKKLVKGEKVCLSYTPCTQRSGCRLRLVTVRLVTVRLVTVRLVTVRLILK